MRKVLLFLVFSAFLTMAQDSVDVTPKMFGYIRSWEQIDLAVNQNAFITKEARFGVRGNVNEYASYKLQLDFTRLGKLTTTTTTIDTGKTSTKKVTVISSASATFSDVLLDAEATFKPDKALSLTLGQFVVPVSTDNLRGGADLEFVNRPLMATTVTPELRDVGFLATYTMNNSPMPVEIKAGVYNGSGQNKAENDRTVNYSARAVVQAAPSLTVAGNFYGGKFAAAKMHMLDFGVDYKIDKFTFSGEFAQRKNEFTTSSSTSNAWFIYALYDFNFGKSMISHIIPALRYEHYDPNTNLDNNEIARLVPGISFEFSKIKFAQMRINYELFDYKDGSTNPDKVIVQFICRF